MKKNKLTNQRTNYVMNQKKTILLFLLFLFIFCGCAQNLTIKNARKAGAKQLTGNQVIQLVSDNTLHMTTWDQSLEADVFCQENGRIQAENTKGESSDGRWQISKGDQLCLQFKDWGDGDKICYSILKMNDSYQAFRGDGGLEYTFTLSHEVFNDSPESAFPTKKAVEAPEQAQEDHWYDFLIFPRKEKDSSAESSTVSVKDAQPPAKFKEEESHWYDFMTFGGDSGEVEEPIRSEAYKRLLETKSCSTCDLSGVDLQKAVLKKADLSGANLSGADLSLANLAKANLSGANLSGANLAEANLVQADLSGADLSGANLHWTILTRANLSGANLKNAFLVKADCYKADFTDADLTDAITQRANFDKAKGIDLVLEGIEPVPDVIDLAPDEIEPVPDVIDLAPDEIEPVSDGGDPAPVGIDLVPVDGGDPAPVGIDLAPAEIEPAPDGE